MEESKKGALVKRLHYLFTKMGPSNELENCYRALTEIRLKFISKSQQMNIFIEEGGIPHIVIQLKKSTPKIVDVALSVLGHCVLEQEPRILFRKAGGLPVLAKVLISFQDTAILSRACRVIGSLAQDKRNSMKLLELSISVHHSLGQIIHSSEHEETLCMAIRAIHKLADSKEHITILGRYYIFPKLCTLLVKSENVNVLTKLFTTLFHIYSYMKRFSETSSHYWVGSEGGGKLIARLVDLRLHAVSLISTHSTELLNLLVQDPHVRPLLAHKDAFNALIPVVIQELESETNGLTIYTKSLFRLCCENPHSFQAAGGIPVLLKQIKLSDPKSGSSYSKKLHSQHASIFSTLLAFKYNQTALLELVECGVIDTLVAKLVTYTEFCRDDKINFERSESCDIPQSPAREDENSSDSELNRSSENQQIRTRCRFKRKYRTTSPSYKAVEMECDLLKRYREAASNSDALNIFGWNCSRNDSSAPSSPVSNTSSPNHSTWSDGEIETDGWSDGSPDFVPPSSSLYANNSSGSPTYSTSSSTSLGSPTALSLSPLRPPSFPSLSDFDDSDEEEKMTCYSPTNFDDDLDSPASSPALPCKKRPRLNTERGKLCCDPDLKMLWLKLGQVDNRDFYENWPEFASSTEQHQMVEVAIYLLLKLSWLNDTPHKLASQSVTAAIIDYLVDTPTPAFRACRILFRLATEPHLFMALLESQMPMQVYLQLNCHISANCCPLHSSLRRVGEQILDQFSLIVSRFGRGEMEKLLTQNQLNDNINSVALATPLIVRKRSELQRFMNDLKVMDIVGDMLRQGGNQSRHAIASLSSLGTFLKMDGLICPQTVLGDVFNNEPCQVVTVEEDVFFKLAPDQLVGGIKSRLQVPFFEAMFRGGFQESNSLIVSLTNTIQPQVFKVILHSIYGCGSQCGVIRSVDRLVTSSRSAANLLQSLDQFLLLEYIDGMSNLIASQDWSSYPARFISLLSALGQFPFSVKLRNHLRFFPFSDAADLAVRFQIVERLLKTDVADEYVDDWKQMFHSKLNAA